MTFGKISSGMTPLQIFFDADLVVQSVIVLLVLASVYSWSVIMARTLAIAIERRMIRTVGKLLPSIETLEELRELSVSGDGRVHEILHSLAQEWKWSNEHASRDYGNIRCPSSEHLAQFAA